MMETTTAYAETVQILYKNLYSPPGLVYYPQTEPITGPYIISGVAGSGKSHMLIELCCRGLIESQAKPVIIVPNRTAKHNLEKMFSRFWRQGNPLNTAGNFQAFALDHKLIQTPHAFAYSILQRAASLKLLVMPQLLSAYEFDGILTDILQGQLQTEASPWPDEMATAVRNPEFIPFLRDFLLRAGEHFINPEQMQQMAYVFRTPIWESIAATMAEYQAINALQAAHSLADQVSSRGDFAMAVSNSSELMEIAVRLLLNEDELLGSIQQSYTHIFVDDAHSFTPDSGYLFRALARFMPGMAFTVDRNLTPFSWRGADRNFIDQFPYAVEYTLDTSVRVPEEIAKLVNNISLSGIIRSNISAGQIGVAACSSTEIWMNNIVESLLCAHENSAISWEDIAIIARDTQSFNRQLCQKLQQERIPFINELSPITLADSIVVKAFNAVLALYSGKLSVEDMQIFLLSPLCGVNGTMAKKIAHIIVTWQESENTDSYKDIKQEIVKLVENRISDDALKALQLFLSGYEREFTHPAQLINLIHALWDNATQHNLIFIAKNRFSQISSQIEQEIYSVELYLEYLHRHYLSSSASLSYIFTSWEQTFANNIAKIAIPLSKNAITLTSAHASAGREWKYVIILGLEENIWPNPRIRTDILDTQKFLLCCNLQMNEPHPRINLFEINLRDERNLLLLALTRASEQIDVIVLDNPHGPDPQRPSDFFSLIQRFQVEKSDQPDQLAFSGTRLTDYRLVKKTALRLNHYILQLRTCLDSENSAQVQHAINMLAYLRHYNIVAADPRHWYNFLPPTTLEPISASDTSIILYPSRIDALAQCPTGWFLSSLQRTSTPTMVNGIIIHAAAEALAQGIPLAEVILTIKNALPEQLSEPEFLKHMRINRIIKIIERLHQTFLARETGFALIASEQSRRVEIAEHAGHAVYLSGRLDRIEQRKSDDMPVIVDIKTGRTPLSIAEAQINLQMLAYRRMLDPLYRSMAQLYYPASGTKKPTFRDQLPLDLSPDEISEFAAQADRFFAQLASLTIGPDFSMNFDPVHICAQSKICSYLREGI